MPPELQNDMGGKCGRVFGGARLIECGGVTIADHLRAGRIAPQVEHPTVEHKYAVLNGRIAESDVVRGDRRSRPIGHPAPLRRSSSDLILSKVLWLLGYSGGIKRLGRHLEHPRTRKILPECLVERGHVPPGVTGGTQLGDREYRNRA